MIFSSKFGFIMETVFSYSGHFRKHFLRCNFASVNALKLQRFIPWTFQLLRSPSSSSLSPCRQPSDSSTPSNCLSTTRLKSHLHLRFHLRYRTLAISSAISQPRLLEMHLPFTINKHYGFGSWVGVHDRHDRTSGQPTNLKWDVSVPVLPVQFNELVT